MAKAMGIGGVFLRCADTEATRDWYTAALGLAPEKPAFPGRICRQIRRCARIAATYPKHTIFRISLLAQQCISG